LGVVGRYAIAGVRWRDSVGDRLVARSLDDGRVITIPGASFGGGSWQFQTRGADGDAWVYFALAGDRLELRRVVPGQAPRVLHDFPATPRRRVAVHQGRVAYSDAAGDSVRLMLDTGGEPRRLLSVPGKDAFNVGIGWSRDGRRIVLASVESGSVLYVLDLAADGSPLGPPKRVALPFDWGYGFSFLPDDRRLAMIGQPRGGAHAIAAVVSLDDPANPSLLSEADGTSTWDLALSPDGQWVAYAEELPPKGTTVYRVDIPDRVTKAVSLRH
jgi:Tol biopolymer transport system component